MKHCLSRPHCHLTFQCGAKCFLVRSSPSRVFISLDTLSSIASTCQQLFNSQQPYHSFKDNMPGIRKQPRVVRASKLVAWFRFLNAYRDGKITVGHLEDMLLKAAERKQFRESKLSEAIVEDSSDVSIPKR